MITKKTNTAFVAPNQKCQKRRISYSSNLWRQGWHRTELKYRNVTSHINRTYHNERIEGRHRQLSYRMIQVFIDHGFFNNFLHRIKKSDTKISAHYSGDKENTSSHPHLECTDYQIHRIVLGSWAVNCQVNLVIILRHNPVRQSLKIYLFGMHYRNFGGPICLKNQWPKAISQP